MYNIYIIFIYLFLSVLGLRCYLRAFSTCSEQGLLPRCSCTHLIIVAHGLSCLKVCGIFPDQGSNLCLLPWRADSLPLSHQGSPLAMFLTPQEC